MKRIICMLCVCMLAASFALCEQTDYATITLRPGDTCPCPIANGKAYEADAPEVLSVSQSGVITARNEGFATVYVTLPDGQEAQCDVTVDINATPLMIQNAIDIALKEWADLYPDTLSRTNKYTRWYCGRACEFGWCGGFAGYCLDEAGVPMTDQEKSVPHDSGEPYSVREAGVGKLLKGFTRMDRLSGIPRPGYLVIYAVRDSVNVTVHVGLITNVEDLTDGKYLLTTVEGNMSSRIKRYCYVYDSAASDKTRNMSAAPEERRTDERIQYTPHMDTWYVNVFCQTWF